VPYLPNTPQDREVMLKAIGVRNIEDLLADIPEAVRLKRALALPPALSEMELVKYMNELAEKNQDTCHTVSFLGGGSYDHYIPAAVDHVISRSEFYTAYTPYQAEVSQGTLQAIYEYQSLVCELTGMDAANASMYDGASGLAEATLLAHAATKRGEFLISEAVHPNWRQVVETYCQGMAVDIRTIPLKDGVTDMAKLREMVTDKTACVVLSQPNFFGCIEEAGEAGKIAHAKGAMFILACDPMSWSLLKSPAEYGADVVVAEGQPFGLPMSFGGPYLGIFAARKDYVRLMPGRIVGVTQDKEGRRGFVLTLQTREQHIRREKATSNICTNEGLCALAATVYLTLMGKQGFRQVGELCLQKAHYLYDEILKLKGFGPTFKTPFFKEFAVRTPIPAGELAKRLLPKGFFAGVDLGGFYPEYKDSLLIAVTEKRTKQEMDRFVAVLKEAMT
jgi:glycine dehydrogenase subunit 1